MGVSRCASGFTSGTPPSSTSGSVLPCRTKFATDSAALTASDVASAPCMGTVRGKGSDEFEEAAGSAQARRDGSSSPRKRADAE
eukprot:4794334-Pleurochrysis_carterae.AAC.1